MPAEVGTIVKGKVTGITKFGAFVEMEGGGTGLCHISEIADGYVKDVNDYLKEGQEITVKVIGDKDGKISLSIRQAQSKKEASPEKKSDHSKSKKPFKNRNDQGRSASNDSKGAKRDRRDSKPQGFEDMLSSFMKDSDSKLKSMKKQKGSRRGNGYQSKR